ncbi:cilia- and flagella-associated protein 46 [Elysia marginata]|uniref:Cilia- and flagella-associated protein 46 n=1 Tax=Elysia marginata TaxID=1093978 RepID=A0AAV4IDK5_9GAST|nr:cilia- and flagella-associated protein 46 [Elysia marginata]
MDASIRKLLTNAENYAAGEKNPALQQAYTLLRNVAETRPAVDAPESFGQDLYVLCAEFAFQHGNPEVAKECLKMFFMRQPAANQFLCRAYLCQAQLMAPQNANNPEQLEKAVVYVLKAISFAKKSQRYHFLVYNASVIYWQFCRPFLKPGYRQYLARSLHQVVKALDDIEDTDYEWRAQLMIALIECHLDAHRRSDASHIATAAASFIKANVPSLYKTVFGLMVRHQLVETAKLHKDLKTTPELAVFYKLCKLKNSVDQEENRDYTTDIQNLLTQMGVSQKPNLLSRSHERLSRRDSKLAGAASSSSSPRDESEPEKRESRPLLLLELARLCLELNLPELATACVEGMKACTVKEQGFYLELEFIQCELMVSSLLDKKESFQKNVIDIRLQAIKRCEEAIMNAVRLGDPNVIQVGCVTQWNLCLPLLQPNMRHFVRRRLSLVAEALENIDSLLVQLRCQVHTELSRCEEDQEQIQVAMEHLKKALSLDDGNIYHERLEVALRRLELRAQLYKQPDRAEDQAAMIIEQARKADSGTIRMKRSLLVRAGEALAPDAFLLVLDSENDTKDVSGGKGPLTKIRMLAGKAYQFNRCVKKAEGHLKRLGDENDRERARLWADLAKTARKQEVWDVCRVASRFCLLYDDGRWKNAQPKRSESPKDRNRIDTQREDSEGEKKPGSRVGSRPSTPVVVPLYDKDLIRTLAEVAFINGEALVQLLRSEGVQLNDQPIPPEDKSKRPKGYVAKKPEEDPDWIEYCEWIKDLTQQATENFLRGLALGVELNEPWIVCSAGAYIWNYNTHVLAQGRHREIVDSLTTILSGLKRVGHAGETVMLVNICNALAQGLIRPWIPEPPKDVEKLSEAGDPLSPKSKNKAAALPASKSKSLVVNISNDAMPDLKKAIEVCDFAMQITNGENPLDVIPIFMRLPVLQTWVKAKQMAQQQISKHLGTDDETNNEGQRPLTRSIVAVEMLSLTKNGIMEFKDVPFIGDIAQMIEDAKWPDKFVELQLWARLTYLAYEANLHNMVVLCSKKALRFAAHGTQPRTRKMDLHKYSVEQEMLSYSSVLLGQSLVDNMKGKNSLRREALEAFLNSAKYARSAGNYELVMTAARHFWNACIPLVSQPIERELLKEPLKIILECIAATAEKEKKEEKQEEEEENEDEQVEEKESVKAPPPAPEKGKEKEKKDTKTAGRETKAVEEKKPEKAKPKESEERPSGMIGKPEDDLTLRAAMYGVLFQSYADQGDWLHALEAIDQAVTDMPRTKHRLLVFKHRVMVKAKLGRNVHMDIQKFKDESEDFVAHMWRRVALSSKESTEQLASYQSAIEALENKNNDYQKVEYLLEFGQWLYSNHFPALDVQDQLEWASDILLNMKTPEPEAVPAVETKKTKAGTRKRAPSASGSKTSTLKGKKAEKEMPDKGAKKTVRKDSGTSKASSDRKGAGKQHAAKGAPSDTHSEASDQDSDIHAIDYVPVVKEADIGVMPANPQLTVQDLTEVRQLDALIRSQVLLAEIVGHESEQHRDILLQAHAYLVRLWQVLINASGATIKEVVKNGGSLVKEEAPKSGKGAPSKDKKDDKNVKKDEKMLTLHYTDSLIQQLRDVGYSHLTLPVLAFQDLLSRTVLESQALFNLVHLRLFEVCQELDIKNAANHHLRILGTMHIKEEDQARSRDEIAHWKEKQLQVAREEQRVKETLARQSADLTSRPKAPAKSDLGQAETAKGVLPEVELHLGKVLGSTSLRDLWTETAEVLTRHGQYQRAREYLNEAFVAAEAFADVTLQSKIYLLLAKLAFAEAQYGKAIMLCHKAQELREADEKFWFETIALLAKATIKEEYSIKSVRKAKKILVYAINEFSRYGDENVNRQNSARFYCAKLETMLVKIHTESILHGSRELDDPQVLHAVLQSCERYEAIAERLTVLRRWRDAACVTVKHGRLLRLLAHQAAAAELSDKELLRVYYMQAVNVMKQASALAEKVYIDAHTLYTLAEMQLVCTPVQRELATVNLELADLLTEVLISRGMEQRQTQLIEERKASITRLVEEYVRESPVFGDKEKQWMDLGRIAGDEALALLLSIHSLCHRIPKLKAKSLVGLGRLLRVVSEHHDSDQPSQWMVHDVQQLILQLAAEEAEAERAAAAEKAALQQAEEETKQAEDSSEAENQVQANPPDPQDDTDKEQEDQVEEEEELEMDEVQIRKRAKDTKTIILKKKQHEKSKFFYMCASECLGQAINFCLKNQFLKLAGKAALEMVVLTGQYEPTAASMMLSLHQSCQASLTLENVLTRSQTDPATSQLAALLHQRRHLLSDDKTTNLSNSSIFKDLKTSLHTDWQAWKKMEVQPNHLDILKDTPSNYNIIILQHSPEKDFLYGAILEKGKGAGPTGVGKPKAGDKTNTSRAHIFGVPTNFRQLVELHARIKSHRKQQQTVLLKREYQRMQAAQRQKMLESLEEDYKTEGKEFSEEARFEEAELEEQFEDIVGQMNFYLRPVLEPICQSLGLNATQMGSNLNLADAGTKDKASKDNINQQSECVILLADPDLMQLPLEASMYLEKVEGVNSVSRDFSLQLLHNRALDDRQGEPEGKDAKAAESKKKVTKEPANFVTRIPGLREAKQKQNKIIPLDRQPQAWQMAVNTNDFRFIVDPYLECAETEPHKPVDELNKVLEKYEQQFTPRWLGVAGDDHTPSVGEWEIYLTESTSFIFFGMERLLAYIPPHKMSALNIPDCNILFSFDLAETAKSFQRQSKLDVLKLPVALNLESPVESAMLSSLTGIKCIINNQWHSTLDDNTKRLHTSMSYILQKGKTTGQTVYMLQNPVKVYEEEQALLKQQEAAAKEGEQQTAKEKRKMSTGGSVKGEAKAESTANKVQLKGAEPDADKDQEEAKDPNVPVVTRAAYNMVCYGMPNLIITQ